MTLEAKYHRLPEQQRPQREGLAGVDARQPALEVGDGTDTIVIKNGRSASDGEGRQARLAVGASPPPSARDIVRRVVDAAGSEEKAQSALPTTEASPRSLHGQSAVGLFRGPD